MLWRLPAPPRALNQPGECATFSKAGTAVRILDCREPIGRRVRMKVVAGHIPPVALTAGTIRVICLPHRASGLDLDGGLYDGTPSMRVQIGRW